MYCVQTYIFNQYFIKILKKPNLVSENHKLKLYFLKLVRPLVFLRIIHTFNLCQIVEYNNF